MNTFLKQGSSLLGAGIATACCLGVPVVLSSLGAVGLSFITYDAYLFPLFVGFIGFNAWLLYRSARTHASLAPFWLGLASSVTGAVALWLLVTGIRPMPWLLYLALATLVVASIWDFINGRRAASCSAELACATPQQPGTPSQQPGTPSQPARRAITGATLSAGAAVAFYAMYKSVRIFTPEASSNEIACWGINTCKGTTACSTAFNACTGQNACKGKGYLFVSAKACALKGGQPLAGSPADPARLRAR